MEAVESRSVVARVTGVAGAFALVGLVTMFIGGVPGVDGIQNIYLVYLVPVLIAAIAWGRVSAALTAITSFLVFAWFFAKPIYSFAVGDPQQWLGLVLFLVSGVIAGTLAGELGHRARIAQSRERETALFFDVARMANQGNLEEGLRAVVERLRSDIDSPGVAITIDEGDGRVWKAVAGDEARIEAARGGLGGSMQLTVLPIGTSSRTIGELAILSPAYDPSPALCNARLLSGVCTQVALAVERHRLRREANEAEILRRTDGLKSALLNAVSHDLRSPLASILTSAENARDRDVAWTEDEREQFLLDIVDQTMRLNRIVGNLLDLSRIDSGSLRPNKAWYDLEALVDDVLVRLRGAMAEHPTVVTIAPDVPPVFIDYVEIDQVLTNIIENSAKFSPPGTEVEISVGRQNGTVVVSVADRGPGIPAEALGRVFDPFYRVTTPGPHPDGTGLGLAVAKGLVVAHDGAITAENRPDGGAIITFTLPICSDNTATEPLMEEQV